MGALQLTYKPTLKIVHRTGELMRSHEAKVVQLWLSVDPLAESFTNINPYVYCYQNPINIIDPTGMAGEDPKRKGGLEELGTILNRFLEVVKIESLKTVLMELLN